MRSKSQPAFSFFAPRFYSSLCIHGDYSLFFIADDDNEMVLFLMAYMFTTGVVLMGYPLKKLQCLKRRRLQNSLVTGHKPEVVSMCRCCIVVLFSVCLCVILISFGPTLLWLKCV